MATAEDDATRVTAWWRRFLVAGLAAAAIHPLLPRGGVAEGLLSVAAQLGVLSAMVAGIRLGRPARRLPWVLLIVGQALLFGAGVFNILGRSEPSLVNDVWLLTYVAWYALLLSALVLLARARGANRGAALDALVFVTGLGVVVWIFLIEPVLRLYTIDSSAKTQLVFATVENLALVAALAWLFFTPGRHPPALRLLLLAVAAGFIADTTSGLASAGGSGASSIDSLLLLSLPFLGAAFLHPSMPEVSEPSAAERPGLQAWRVPLMAVTALIPSTTLIVETLLGRGPHASLVGLTTMVMIPMAFARIRGLMVSIDEHRRIQAQLEQSQAWYKGLVEELPAFTYVDVPDGRPSDGYLTIYASPQIEGMFGYTSEEFIEDPELWGRMLHPDDRERQFAEDAHQWQTGERYSSEYRVFARDGRVVWVRNHSVLVRGVSDSPTVAQGVIYDITESKRAQEALAEAERRYRGLFENAAEPIFVTTLEGHYLLANPALAEMLGYSSPQELVDDVTDVAGMVYADPSRREEFLRRLDLEDTLRGFEYQVARKDGSLIWVSENIRAVRDPDGRLVGCEGMSIDITARKRAEQALSVSEERFRQLSEAAFEGVVVDVGGHIAQANRAFCEMFGLSPDEVVGSSPMDAVAPESLPRVYEYLRSGSETPEDIELVRADGSRLVVETTIRRIERNREEAHLITMHDVTERRAIEDILRRRDAVLGAVTFAAERFLDGPWEADIDGVLARLGEATDSSRVGVFRNEPGVEGALLMTLAYEWAAPGISTTIHDPDNEHFSYEGGYASWIDELRAGRIIHGNRSDFPDAVTKDLEAEDVVSIALVPVFAGDAWWGYLSFDDCVDERVWSEPELGPLQTVAGVLAGAIARTNAERALGRVNAELEERVTERTAEVVVAMQEAQRAKESAERASRAKSEFLSRASHELRTPLNAILGFGQLLEGSALPEEDSESVEEIVRAGRHLLELVNQVLDISGLDAGRLALSIEPVSVEDVVHEALDLIGPQALGRGIQLRTNIPPDGLHVMADLQRLEQVLLNLLSNAVKFDREEGTVTVTCDASEERVVLRVTDTGPGIAPERLERLFTPFDRLGAETIGGAGAGLGLALCKSLADAMGGSIRVESVLDVGTTFAVELPRAEAPAPDRVAEPASTRAASP